MLVHGGLVVDGANHRILDAGVRLLHAPAEGLGARGQAAGLPMSELVLDLPTLSLNLSQPQG